MRRMLAILGLSLLAAGLAMLALIASAAMSGLSPWQPLGSLWFAVDADSLNGAQVLVERYVWPPLWSRLALPMLALPAPWPAAAALAVGALACGCAWWMPSRAAKRAEPRVDRATRAR